MSKVANKLTNRVCRICGGKLSPEPLLQYRNMPKAAQNMPRLTELENEKGADLDVYQCAACGLIQLGGEPVSYYREVIRAAGFSPEMKAFRLRQFDEFICNYHLSGKSFLEVGCGRGEYLELLKEAGLKAYGIEYSQSAVDACKAKGLDVVQGFIDRENYQLDNGPFDGFAIFSWLEHVPKPNAVLKGIVNNLSDDAWGIVEVPNFELILKEKLFSEFIGDHLFYFTKDTLQMTLAKNGLEPLNIHEVWHHYILSANVRKRKRTDLSSFVGSQQRLVHQIQEFISQFPKNQVAVWGASHQALAILSLADLGEKIRYVVDSAPFKQGKYTPATHIPIVAPDTLNTDPVKAVIVTAASYNDEVVRIIKKRYSQNIITVKVEKNHLEKDA
jgi:2-polyprenyl-3-methyl-5-hydroxy-6-metoxy-1,4-benzoquinol methylase